MIVGLAGEEGCVGALAAGQQEGGVKATEAGLHIEEAVEQGDGLAGVAVAGEVFSLFEEGVGEERQAAGGQRQSPGFAGEGVGLLKLAVGTELSAGGDGFGGALGLRGLAASRGQEQGQREDQKQEALAGERKRHWQEK